MHQNLEILKKHEDISGNQPLDRNLPKSDATVKLNFETLHQESFDSRPKERSKIDLEKSTMLKRVKKSRSFRMKMSDEIVSVQVHFHNQYYFGSLTFSSWILYQYQYLGHNWDVLFQDEKDKPKITKKQNYVVFRHKPKEKSRSKSKDDKERIQIESESSDEETQSFLHRSTKESSFLNRFLKTSENLEEKGTVLFQIPPKKTSGFSLEGWTSKECRYPNPTMLYL